MQEESSLNFADRFSRAIARAGLKPARISDLTGLSKGYLSELLSGKKYGPSPEAAKKLAGVLGVSPEWLVHGSVQQNAESYVKPKDGLAPKGQEFSSVMREEPAQYGKPLADLREFSREIDGIIEVREWGGFLERIANALERLIEIEDEKRTKK